MIAAKPTANPRTSQLQMAYKSNGLQGAMNMVKSNRTSNISMSAAFASNGAPLGRRPNMRKNEVHEEFTITHNVVEKPWGFPRATKTMMAEAIAADDFL